jgi:hypothetical protein
MNDDEDYKERLRLAMAIFRQSPLAGEGGFSMRDAMVMAGVEKDIAESETFNKQMLRLLKGNPEIELPSDEDSMVERAVHIFCNSKVGADGKRKTMTDCMRVAGCNDEPTTRRLYMRCTRRYKSMEKKADQAELVDWWRPKRRLRLLQ